MVKHIYKKTNKKRGKSKKCSTCNRRRKIRGGVSFNEVVTSHPIPANEYLNDPSRDVITSRTLPFSQTGGKSKRRRGKGKGKKSRKSRKMKGGSLKGNNKCDQAIDDHIGEAFTVSNENENDVQWVYETNVY